jgi:dethiobiotin synthetase
LRGCFITGTDTGAGKTVLAGALTAALRKRGFDAVARKPVITGLDEPEHPCWPRDDELLAAVSDCRPEAVSCVRFGPPVSPHLAAKLAGTRIDPAELLAAVRAAADAHDLVIVEGVGGLLVPLHESFDVLALAGALGLPVVVAARAGLGTINHTLLTLQAARAGGLAIAGVVLGPWPRYPGRLHESNRETIERLGGVAVSLLPELPRFDTALMAAAGETLPFADWLAAGQSS